MALLTAQSLQKQGHEVTLYTFDHSPECFPELQKGITIRDRSLGNIKTGL
jgi:2-polyprenyl-6-methoxyphenol hydroxylase-like FAD-dependent oxidoreductase